MPIIAESQLKWSKNSTSVPFGIRSPYKKSGDNKLAKQLSIPKSEVAGELLSSLKHAQFRTL